MFKVYKEVTKLFSNFFKLIEENKQINIVRAIIKDDEGNTIIEFSPIGTNEKSKMSPYQFIKNPIIKKQFRLPDVKIIESILIAEGDIFFLSKDFNSDQELYNLKSYLSNEEWCMKIEDIMRNKNIFARLNKKYFDKNLNITRISSL